jgi:large subunit ribosomal protein L9
VILTEYVSNLGQAGEIVEVADGYGRNFLIRRGLAKLATPGEIKQAEQLKRTAARRRRREAADNEALAERLNEMTLTFEARAGEGTKLYGSITSSDIADRISEELGQDFDRRKIHLDESLRQLGTHQVTIRLTANLSPEITVVIEREEEQE